MSHPRSRCSPVRGRAFASSRGRISPALVVLLLAAVVVGAGCSGDDLGSDAGRVLVGSSLEVAVDDGWEAVEVGDAIPDGARVRTGEGEARLELRDGEVWLAPGSMAVVSREVVDAIRGDLLVLSAGRLAARSGDTDIAGRSTFRLTPGITPLLRVYEGSADVQRPGEERTLAARREIGLAATRLATQSSPLSYDPADPWDRRLLPTAVAFDGEVARLARGIDRQHGTEPQAAEFYETFSAVSAETIPVLVSVSRRVLSDDRFGPPSDALVTLFVAEAVAAAGEQTLAEAAREVTRWRQRGARWGLVALELDISTSALAVAVNLGQERRLAVEQEAVPEPVEPASADPASADAAPPAPTTTPAPTAPSTTSPQPAPTQGAASSPPPPPPPPTSTSPSPPSPPAQPSPPDAQVPLPEPSPPPPTLSSPVDAAAKVVEDVVGGITDTSGSLLGD